MTAWMLALSFGIPAIVDCITKKKLEATQAPMRSKKNEGYGKSQRSGSAVIAQTKLKLGPAEVAMSLSDR